ncbi:efflux RND transporter periplasmic adaptor subunit [Sphingobacterium griseoflavum]|uniref:MexH family multidrug efflux RND transporter periplasmic adaptor subunit n=1 Tax=Sphingobacterium griseoflavum TaxID=1474952 RepID=A0ABQ3HPF4_9SPHI|nr:efflux RND transporter periplasmic adaptor subunit [Sphingobacterium griseoflavum]GHE23125.1 MexH family multidrug efflux RND transporter periplasmic adaptor subunit [Sphingobacterium griseoflavum]
MKTLNLFTLVVVTLTASVSLQACRHSDRTNAIPAADTIPVALMALQHSSSTAAFEATGTFTTNDETLLSFKSGGVIERMYVREGDLVRPGQLLARVHMDEVDARASQARLAVEKAQRDYDRAHQLYRDSVSTLEQLQNAQTALRMAQQDVKSIQFNRQYSEIRSTSSGYVLARLAQEGQVVGPGTPVFQINGANEGNWELKVGMSDRQWAATQVGDTASVQADALGDGKLKAVVRRKAEGLDPSTGTFSVFLGLLEKPKHKLAAGMFATAKLQSRARNNSSWHIPYAALLDGDGKEGYVFVTNDNRIAKRVKVTLGPINADQVTVLSGLEDAKGLIVSGSPYLVDGASIRVVKQN